MSRQTTVLIAIGAAIALLALAAWALGSLGAAPAAPPRLLPAAPQRATPPPRAGADHAPAQAPTGEPVVAAPPRAATGPAHAADPTSATAAPTPSAPPLVPFLVIGRCVRGAEPVADCVVVLRRRDGVGPTQTLRTDANGGFRRALPGPGVYELEPRPEPRSQHQRTFLATVRHGEPCDLGPMPLRPRVRVRGTVRAPDGAPAAALVELEPVDELARRAAPIAPVPTGADGTFAFDDVPSGAWRAIAARDDAHGSAALAIAEDPLADPPGVELRLREQVACAATVVDDDGQALAGADVRADTDDEPPLRAVADADGRFALLVPRGTALRIAADGCLEAEIEPDAAAAPGARLVLRRLHELRGVIAPAGPAGHVRLQPVAGAAPPPAVAEVLARRHPIDQDGGFAVSGLVRGDYWLTAALADGAVAGRVVAVPPPQPLQLDLVAGTPVPVAVRDERGAPAPFATVRALDAAAFAGVADAELAEHVRRHERASRWPCGADGTAILAVPTDRDLVLALHGDGYLPVARRWPATAVAAAARAGDEAPLVLEVVRRSLVRGRVTEPVAAAPWAAAVALWPRGADPARAQRLPIDDDGAFCSAPLPAGSWQVALVREDRTSRAAALPARPDDLPLLGGGVDSRTTVLAEAPPGGEAVALLPAPPLARIDGRVLRNGRGIRDVAVFGVPAGSAGPGPVLGAAGFDAHDAHEYAPHTRTAADGSFSMLVARPGTFDLRARHRGQPLALAPTQVTVPSHGAHVQATLVLPTGEVRGRVAAQPARDPVRFAVLYPAAAAAVDPFAAPPYARADFDSRLRLPAGADRTFAFSAVPPGVYVLRLCSAARVLHQEAVAVQDGVVDLGEVRPPANAAPAAVELQPRPPRPRAVHVLRVLPGVPDGAFAVGCEVTGALRLDGLPAGDYRLRWLPADGDARTAHAAAVTSLRLHADGTTTPKTLAPPAPARR
ncbi:MAG: hypothetical protein AB7O97_19840 [Planctomycetota bacterium]